MLFGCVLGLVFFVAMLIAHLKHCVNSQRARPLNRESKCA